MMSSWKRFFMVDHKTFDKFRSRRRNEEMCICEKGKGLRVEIILENKDIRWIVEALVDFYWRKGGKSWEKQINGDKHNLFIALGRNGGGVFLF